MNACVDILTCLLAVLVAGACSSGSGEQPSTDSSDATAIATPTPAVVPVPEPTAEPVITFEPTATPAPTVTALPLAQLDLEPAFPELSFERMVVLTYADDGTERLFLVEQPGRIMVFENRADVEDASLFLDIRERVSDRGNEEGLLGLAFDPEFSANGYLYVYYSAASPRRSVVSRFSVSSDGLSGDPSSETVVLEVPQPFSNHNGGQILFGPDGYLYIGLGDGGSGGDPRNNGQNPGTLLGTILRIDVRALDEEGTYRIPPDNPFVDGTGEARPEIWAYGLRNPWRFTFDRETGDLWAADVGQNRFEEVDVIKPGLNYGWNIMEGNECFGSSACDDGGLEPPIFVYDRGGGCSVTGGYVYRGTRLPSLYGAYVYGDFCSGKIWALRMENGEVVEHIQLIDSRLSIPSFAEDPTGEMLVLSFDGRIYKFVER